LIEENPSFHADLYKKNREKILERNKEQQKKYKDKINERNKGYRQLEQYKKKAAEAARKRVASDPNYSKKEYEKRKEKFDTIPGYKDAHNAKQRAFKSKYPDKYKSYVMSDEARERRRIKTNEWGKMKNATDPQFKIAKNIRSRTRLALKRCGAVKADSVIEKMLGCSIEFFKDYFSSLFTEGMSWDRFMAGDIHIDHITPCIQFDLTNPEEQRICFHYTNLQPLWEIDNLKKGRKLFNKKAA